MANQFGSTCASRTGSPKACPARSSPGRTLLASIPFSRSGPVSSSEWSDIRNSASVLLQVVEQALRFVTMRYERRRDLGDKILDLRILDGGKQGLGHGIDHGVVKIDFVLKIDAVEGAATQSTKSFHRGNVLGGQGKIGWRRWLHVQ